MSIKNILEFAPYNYKHRLLPVFFILLGIFVYWLVVAPAFKGGFVFDDWPNLTGLSTIGNSRSIWSFVFDGVSSSLGRPLSYLTFALQAGDWPSNPEKFKKVNVVIHSFNGLLLYIFVLQLALLNRFNQNRQGVIIAGAASFLWLFLPLHSSTVFYVVQRMTLLSFSFTLIGLNFLLFSRFLYDQRGRWPAVFVLLLGFVIGYLFGILSKENAILLGVLALATDVIVPTRQCNVDKVWKSVYLSGCLIPLGLLIIYLIDDLRFQGGYSIREFDVAQRLLTETIILWDYLTIIFFPTAESLNLYNDGYPIASSFFNWPFPGVAIAAWILIILLGVYLQKVFPYLLFAVLWYLGGHFLESSILGLELYFEHRNYLPSVGLLVAFVFGLYKWINADCKNVNRIYLKTKNKIVLVVVMLYFSWFIIVLRIEAETWGDPQQFALAGISERPNSLRAFQEAGAYFANNGQYAISYNILEKIEEKWPGYPGTTANKILLNCLSSEIPKQSNDKILKSFENGKFDMSIDSVMNEVLKVKKLGGCHDVSWDQFRKWNIILLNNKNLIAHKENLVVLIAYSFNAEGRFIEAAKALYSLDDSFETLGFMLLKVRFEAMAENYEKALVIIQEIKNKYESDVRIWSANKQSVLSLENEITLQLKLNSSNEY